MKNAMKKLLSLALALVLVVGVCPMAAFAAENDEVATFSMSDAYRILDEDDVKEMLKDYAEYKMELAKAIVNYLKENGRDGIYEFIRNWIKDYCTPDQGGNDTQNPDGGNTENPGTGESEGSDPAPTTYTITLVVYEEKDNTRKQWDGWNSNTPVVLTKNSTTMAEMITKSGYGEYESAEAKVNGKSVGRAEFVIADGDQVDLYIVPASKGNDKDHNKPNNDKDDNKHESNKPSKPENNKPNKGEKVTLRVWHNDGTSNYTDIKCYTTDNLLDVINSSKELKNLSRKGYELIGWAFEANNDKDQEWIAAQHTVADDDDLRVYADWKESKNSKPNRPDDDKEHNNQNKKYTVTVDFNYDHVKDDAIKNVEKNTKMSQVLKRIDEPTRKGYKFAGWYWDAKCKDDVDGNDKVTKDCTIYAKWTKKTADNEVLLRIYVNGNTDNAAKVYDMDDYDNDGKITLKEAEKVVRKYYEEKYDDDDMDVDGLFTKKTWNDGDYNMKKAVNTIEVNENDDTIIYVMVRDAQKISSGKADTSNPKTGDTIFMAVTVMALSATALAAVYVFNKKRAAK